MKVHNNKEKSMGPDNEDHSGAQFEKDVEHLYGIEEEEENEDEEACSG